MSKQEKAYEQNSNSLNEKTNMKTATTERRRMTDIDLAREPILREMVRTRLKSLKKVFKSKTGQTGVQMQENLGWGKGVWMGLLYSDEVRVKFTTGRIETLTRYMGGDVNEMLAYAPVPKIEPLLKPERTTQLRFASNDDASSRHEAPADIALHQTPTSAGGSAERCPFNVELLAKQMVEQEVAELVSIRADDMSMINLTTLIADLTGVLCKRATQHDMPLGVPAWE